MCAVVVEVSVEFLNPLLFSGKLVVESLLLDDGEGEPDFADLGKVLVPSLILVDTFGGGLTVSLYAMTDFLYNCLSQ